MDPAFQLVRRASVGCASSKLGPADWLPAALGANVLLAPAELAGGHVALHDVHAVLLIKGDARDLVKADYVVLANQTALASGVIHKHFGHGPGTDNDGGAPVERELDIIPFPAIDRDLERRIEAMISRKLEGPGKTVVDLRRLDELEEAIDGLMRVVRAMR